MLQVIPKSSYMEMISEAKLLEKDGRGPKVYATTDGRIIKLFRVKRRISSNLLKAYARRFAENASKLDRLGVRTLAVEFYGKVPHIDRQIVIYSRLPGTSLRDALREADQADGEELMRRFGCFLAVLHEKGILFRSLHFGNVLVEGDDMSLIDILDLKVFRKPLDEKKRIKNIRFLAKYPVDRAAVCNHLNFLREGYNSVVSDHPHLFEELESLANEPG